MKIASSKQRSYEIDSAGFLFDSRTWDEEFVRIMAPRLGIREGLTDEHWRVIKYIRSYFESQGLRPTIWETCRTNGLDPGRLYTLFPAGYLRGACKLAGLGYWNGYVKSSWLKKLSRNADAEPHDKVYRTDARGFLVDPTEWDRNFAVHRAQDLDMPHGVTDSHWKVIDFLRSRFRETLVVPTLQETCDTLQLDLDEIEELFPDGYHRGAVKLAGLRAH